MPTQNVRVNDIVTFFAVGRVVKVFGEDIVVRDYWGKKYRIKTKHVRHASENTRKYFYRKTDVVERHEHRKVK